jgi:hypothetical protein
MRNSVIRFYGARSTFLRLDFAQWQDADQRAQGDNEAADPHPDHQRAHQHFESRLITVDLAETRQDQIYIFVQARLMDRAADGRLLGGKKFEGWMELSLILFSMEYPETAFHAIMGRLLRAA